MPEKTIKGVEKLEKYLKGIAKLKRSDLNKIKVIGLADINRHFVNSEGPTGKWKSLKFRKGKPELDTGRLRASIQGAVEPKQVEWGTNLIYARVQNDGYPPKNIPPRTFLWISSRAASQMVEIFIKRLEK